MNVRRSPSAAWVPDSDDDYRCYVALLPSGPPIVLAGSAVLVWTLLDGGSVDSLIERVSELTAMPADVIGPDIEALIAELITSGLVEQLT